MQSEPEDVANHDKCYGGADQACHSVKSYGNWNDDKYTDETKNVGAPTFQAQTKELGRELASKCSNTEG